MEHPAENPVKISIKNITMEDKASYNPPELLDTIVNILLNKSCNTVYQMWTDIFGVGIDVWQVIREARPFSSY